MYFIIHNSEGDTSVEMLSKEELLERLDEEYYGPVEFIDKITERDTNYWGEGALLIIKGEIAVPNPVETVTKLEID